MLLQSVTQAAAVIRAGAVLAYPTEAVFGLGCDPNNTQALSKLLELKQRPVEKGLILIATDWEQLHNWLLPFSNSTWSRLNAPTHHPTTWVLPVQPHVSPLVRGTHTSLAVRITQHPICRALCETLGYPLISTSANPATAAPARTIADVQQYFGEKIDILNAELGQYSQPSEIRDGLSGAIIRPV